jgi:hypothetical protein
VTRDRVKQEMAKVVVGQNDIIDSLLIGCCAAATSCCTACPAWQNAWRTLARTLKWVLACSSHPT